MLNSQLDITLSDQTEKSGTITDKHLGNVMVNKFGGELHVEQVDNYGLGFIRFPGGTIAEHAKVINGTLVLNNQRVTHEALSGGRLDVGFDLTHSELFSPLALFEEDNPNERTDVVTFSEALAISVERDAEFNLIIPVQRYYLDQDLTDPATLDHAIATARSDVETFITRLKAGHFNDGVLPNTLLFDIGNEPYSDPFAYAIIAKEIINTIDTELNGAGISYEIGIQMGNGTNTHRKLLEDGYFDALLDEGEPALESMAGFEASDQHYADFDERVLLVDRAMVYILDDELANIDYVRHHNLAVDIEMLEDEDAIFHQREEIAKFWQDSIAASTTDLERPEYYVSAWTTDASNSEDVAYTLAGATNVLAVFKNFAETGVDRAALWGLVGSYNYSPEDMLPTVVSDFRSEIVSPSLNLLAMLAENITDSEYLEVESSFTTESPSQQHFFAFEAEDQFTFYVSAGELNNDELNLDLRLAGVSLDLDLDVQHLKIIDGSSTGNSEIVDETYKIRDGELSIRFDQDYEIVQIVAPKNATLSSYEQNLMDKVENATHGLTSPNEIRGNDRGNSILGTEFSDVIFGRAGDDALSGGGGRTNYFSDGLELDSTNSSDFLFGGAGDDMLHGYDGSDVLHGGDGDDYLVGGGGADTFIFTKGDDIIEDFDYRVDQLKLSASLLNENKNNIDRLISHEGEDLILSFEGDHSLTLQGAGHLTTADLNLTTDESLIF